MTSRSVCERPGPLALARPAERRTRPAEPPLAATAGVAARIAGELTMAVLAVALVVRLAFAGWARHVLAYRFPGIPARPSIVATIFLHNLHALVAIGGALLVAQSPHLLGGSRRPGSIHAALRSACEAVLVGGVVANVIVFGASFGAYGTRMVRAALPHGPLEVTAYSLALALYLQGRSRPLATRHVVAVATLCTSALAAAALLETYVNV